MRHVARAILALYPAAWRRRYGDELRDIVACGRPGAADLLDLLRGAFDARRHPGLVAELAASAVPPATQPVAASVVRFDRPPYGIVASPSVQTLSRRSFMRRMLGAGVGLLSLEFLGGTIAFLWPTGSGGLGVEHTVGTVTDIIGASPAWANGRPWEFRPAKAFLVNVPAAMAWARGEEVEIRDPGAAEILALWRKCPHLGCMIPNACEERGRFQCYCHQSTYNVVGEKLHLGPAPRGMDRFPVRVDAAGVVHVDTRQVIAGPPRGVLTFEDPWPPQEGCA